MNLPVVSDTYVRGGTYSTINYSTETTMTVKKNDPNAAFARQGYLKFNKPSVSGPITSAKIRLYVESIHSNATSVPIRAFGINNNSWSEAGITFANQPTEAGVSQGSATATGTAGYIYLDVTSFVNSQSGATISFRLAGIDHDAGAVLATKENATASKRPVLIIN
nr:DNRLRE domain-containing protein [Paenibacillus paeoniae]